MNRIPLAVIAAFIVLSQPTDMVRAAGTKRVVPEAYPTIQAAVDASVAGDTVEIQRGLYDEYVEVIGKTDFTLVAKKGAGFYGGGGLLLDQCVRVRVIGLTITDEASDSNYSIQATNCTNLLISRCRITSAYSGIQTEACTNVEISKCTVESVRDSGITDERSENILILKNTVIETQFGFGIALSSILVAEPGTRVALVAGNRVVGSGDQGIQVVGTDIRVEKNLVERADGQGIITGGYMVSTGIIISKNTVRGSKYGGIWLRDAGNQAAGNKIYDSGAAGLRAQGQEHRILKNTVQNAKIGLELEADRCVIEKNKLSGAAESGIKVTGNENLIEKNTAVGNGPPDFTNAGSGNIIGKNKFGTTGEP